MPILITSLYVFFGVFAEIFCEVSLDPCVFDVSVVMHPNNYNNKILFASKQGSLQLWNIRRSELIYTFSGWDSAVTCVEQVRCMSCVKCRVR